MTHEAVQAAIWHARRRGDRFGSSLFWKYVRKYAYVLREDQSYRVIGVCSRQDKDCRDCDLQEVCEAR